jgi:hypothetical protein
MDQSLTGKKKAAAKRRQKKWRLSPEEWEMLAKLCSVLEVQSCSAHMFKHLLITCAEISVGNS